MCDGPHVGKVCSWNPPGTQLCRHSLSLLEPTDKWENMYWHLNKHFDYTFACWIYFASSYLGSPYFNCYGTILQKLSIPVFNILKFLVSQPSKKTSNYFLNTYLLKLFEVWTPHLQRFFLFYVSLSFLHPLHCYHPLPIALSSSTPPSNWGIELIHTPLAPRSLHSPQFLRGMPILQHGVSNWHDLC